LATTGRPSYGGRADQAEREGGGEMTGTPNTRVAEILVAVGYLIGAAGVCVGFATREPAGALAWVALISVGGLVRPALDLLP
jgi:hypothetical protein